MAPLFLYTGSPFFIVWIYTRELSVKRRVSGGINDWGGTLLSIQQHELRGMCKWGQWKWGLPVVIPRLWGPSDRSWNVPIRGFFRTSINEHNKIWTLVKRLKLWELCRHRVSGRTNACTGRWGTWQSIQSTSSLSIIVWCFHHSLIDNHHSSSSMILHLPLW